MNNEVLNAIKTRRSIRKYKAEQITDEQLDAILEAGTYAATGMGKQSPVIVVVQKPELIAKLSKMNAAVMGTTSDPFYGAPTVLIVLADPERGTYVEDGSLVMGNLMLAAHAVGRYFRNCVLSRSFLLRLRCRLQSPGLPEFLPVLPLL